MPTPADDYNSEHAALEAELTASNAAAASTYSASTSAATTALDAAKLDPADALATQEHISDEVYLRQTAINDEVLARKLAVAAEKRDRKEGDSLEKRDRRIADDQLKTFTGVDYHTTDAGTNFDTRYTGANPVIDLNAPVTNGNSLELTEARLWQQLKNFQIDTTRFINSKFPAKSFPLFSLSGVPVDEGNNQFDTKWGATVGGSPGTPSGYVPELTVIGDAIDPAPFNSSYQGWSGSNLTSKRLVRIYQAIGETVEANGKISGLMYHLTHDELPGWDARTRANAIAAASQIVPDPSGAPNAYFGSEQGSTGAPYEQFDPGEDRRGTITIGDQQFAWETKFETGQGQVSVNAKLRGPVGGSVSAGAPGTPGESAHSNWFATTQLGVIAVNADIFTFDNYFYKGVNTGNADFDGGRVAYAGTNQFLINVSGVVDTYLTVWYRILETLPIDAGPSSVTNPWRVAAAAGASIDAAIQAGLAEYVGTINHTFLSTTSMLAVTIDSDQYIQFGVNALSSTRGARPQAILTSDPTGHIYGGAVNIIGLNVPTTQAPITYGS